MTTALAYPDTDGIRTQTLDATDAANAIVVTDAATYEAGGAFLKRVKAILKQIAETFDGPIADAHTAHKSMLAAKKKHADPLAAAERTVKNKMVTWKRAEEARQAEKRRKLEAEERRREEERRLAEAERLEAQGRNDEAEAVIEAPVVTPPVVMAPAAPKVAGVSTRKVWKFEIVDVSLIPRQYMMPNERAIRSAVQTLGKAATIPGVRAYQDDVMAVA